MKMLVQLRIIDCGQLALDLLSLCSAFDRHHLMIMEKLYGFTDRSEGVVQVTVLLDT